METYGLKLNFNLMLKKFQQKGILAWEYNPLRNYRLDQDMLYYKDQLWTYLDFYKKFVGDSTGITEELAKSKISEKVDQTGWIDGLSLSKEFSQPVVYQKGSLVDFITDELTYDATNPVEMLPSYSYDDSVDIIINDNKSKPKLINSRFSATGYNNYQIVDRNGSNDVNIYDRGVQFDIDTSLYKSSSNIPEITFEGCSYGGNLKIGNYFFYFKYVDADGNESDFIGSSGLVSVFLGNSPQSINSGFKNQNSSKRVKFTISNTDPAYQDLIIYYTRASSNIQEDTVIETCKFVNKFKISDTGVSNIVITGFENVLPVSDSHINLLLQTYNSAKTQVLCQNRLFLGNLIQEEEKYDELLQCALNIYPEIDGSVECEVNKLSSFYGGNIQNTYYDPKFIYNYTGYWDDELYRFGVVFIKQDNTLSYVYNVRGLDLSITNLNLRELAQMEYPDNTHEEGGIRSYDPSGLDKIQFDEYNYKILNKKLTSSVFENSKGVCYIPGQNKINTVIGIKFNIPEAVKKHLKKLKIKGLFFVRQKRIPTTLCQAYTIYVDKLSHLPVIPTKNGNFIESFLKSKQEKFKYYNDEAEKEYHTGYLLTDDVSEHLRHLDEKYLESNGAICPDYDVNLSYLNSLFTGSEFIVQELYQKPLQTTSNPRLFESNEVSTSNRYYNKVKIIGIEDNMKMVGIDNSLFSARAGEAEEARHFAWVGEDGKAALEQEEEVNYFTEALKIVISSILTGGISLTTQLATGQFNNYFEKNETLNTGNNIVRGSFGSYLGITGFDKAGCLLNIKIPGYDKNLITEYMEIRANDKTPFYSISDRITWESDSLSIEEKQGQNFITKTCYRGDCYISKFTHRINRNFVDPSAPTNSNIVDEKCWALGIQYKDGVLDSSKLVKVNVGDINSVDLGLWTSFIIRSNINHSVRSIDESQLEEKILFGNARGFYPYSPLDPTSPYKIPEAAYYNKGFERGVSEQIIFEIPTVPYIKNNFTTRIAYSNIRVSDAFQNAYRTFPGTNFQDYPINYGAIVKLLELEGNLICVLEHGIFRIPVNERAVATSGEGGPAYINTERILPKNPVVLSDTFGSQWADSIIQTPAGIYGVDTVSKKIWRIDRSGGFSIMSDFSIQSFLNDNISFTERELTPIIGIKNVKTHYNAFKKDVMFTFYDDSKGFDEVVWNLCWNEILSKWVTFYSWVPSFSGNIYNQYFSFNRDSSKYISKLAMTLDKFNQNRFKVSNVIIDNTMYGPGNNVEIGKLEVTNPLYSSIKGDVQNSKLKEDYSFELIRDPFGNKDKFYIEDNKLYCKGDLSKYIHKLSSIKEVEYNSKIYTYNDGWFDSNNIPVTSSVTISQLNKIRKQVWRDKFYKKDPVFYLNVRLHINLVYSGSDSTLAEFVATKNTSRNLDGGDIDYTIALIPEEHLDALSTDFWKHGQSGIIDISDEIQPTMWYGKQHPFEFEFVVNEKPTAHKIFDNLQIISNNAEPESFHYEIVGDSYEFAKDKKNMYIRQEATKALFQNLGSNISYNDNYLKLDSEHRFLTDDNGNEIKDKNNNVIYDKSTLFPLYYYRQDQINTIEDYYHTKSGDSTKDYSALSGAEVIYDDKFKEFKIQNHVKGIPIDGKKGRLRGNMHYKEDKWYVQINPLNIIQCNEPSWKEGIGASGLGLDCDGNKVPIEIDQYPLPNDLNITQLSSNDVVEKDRNIVQWKWEDSQIQEVKMKDKWIKIRVRYDGKKLAVINAIMTLFSISYS